jgi:hypothetical protein
VMLGPKMFKNYPTVRGPNMVNTNFGTNFWQLNGLTAFGVIMIATTTTYVAFLLAKLFLYNSLKNVLLAVLPYVTRY